MLENQTARGEQSSAEHLYQLDIERVRLLKIRTVGSVFVANYRGLLQVLNFFPCNSFGIANVINACFVDFLAQ